MAVVCIVAVPVGLTAAQSGTSAVLDGNEFSDDFEDGDIQEYTVSTGDIAEVTNESFLGGEDDYELHLADDDTSATVVTYPEPINLTGEEASVEVDFRTEDNTGIQAAPIRLNGPEMFQLIHDYNDGLVIDSTVSDRMTVVPREEMPGHGSFVSGPPPADLHANYTIDFEDEEIRVTVTNKSDGQTWNENATFTSSVSSREGYDISYRIQVVDNNDPQADLWIDNVGANGDGLVGGQESLSIDVNNYQRPGTEQHYSVELDDDGSVSDVTGTANVTLSHPDILTVNESRRVLNATSNRSALPQEVTITAEYENLETSKNVTVAKPTVENLHLLPTWWKVNATVGDGMMLWLIVATLAAVVATRAATSFAGIGGYTMIMISGWMAGPVSDGVMVATIFTALFLGLNLAANVDTSVRGTG